MGLAEEIVVRFLVGHRSHLRVFIRGKPSCHVTRAMMATQSAALASRKFTLPEDCRVELLCSLCDDSRQHRRQALFSGGAMGTVTVAVHDGQLITAGVKALLAWAVVWQQFPRTKTQRQEENR